MPNVKIPKQVYPVRLDPELITWADEFVRNRHKTRAWLIKELFLALRDGRMTIRSKLEGPVAYPLDELVIGDW